MTPEKSIEFAKTYAGMIVSSKTGWKARVIGYTVWGEIILDPEDISDYPKIIIPHNATYPYQCGHGNNENELFITYHYCSRYYSFYTLNSLEEVIEYDQIYGTDLPITASTDGV